VTEAVCYGALILRPGRTDQFLVRREGQLLTLPRFAPEVKTFFGGDHANRPLAAAIGAPVWSLDCVHWRSLPEGHRDVVLAFEALGEPARPKFQWVATEAASDVAFEDEVEQAAVTGWLAETASGTATGRAEWCRPGWRDKAAGWMAAELKRHGVDGPMTIEQEQCWSLSSLVRASVAGSRFYLKAVPPLFGNEPAITAALAEWSPASLPAVLAVHEQRRWMLMADFGGASLSGRSLEDWCRALETYAEMQRLSIGRPELERLLPAKPLSELSGQLANILQSQSVTEQITADEAIALQTLLPRLEEDVARLTASGIPPALVHGDLHPGNVQWVDGRPLYFDWTDACLSHPFMDLITFFRGRSLPDEPDAPARLEAAYLGAWREFTDRGDVNQIFASAMRVGAAFQLRSYIEISKAIEPGRHWQVAEFAFWVRLLLTRLT